jgi:UDP:flavonoid glycosyltransferase YjiC (YdhE family)
MKALWYGVPMAQVLLGRDQSGVAAGAEHLGVASILAGDQLIGTLLTEAITRVLEDPHYHQKAQKVVVRKGMLDRVRAEIV